MASSTQTPIHDASGEFSRTYYPIVIIGAGPSGIAMGCQLKRKLHFDQFMIFDRQEGLGGKFKVLTLRRATKYKSDKG